MFQDRNMSFRGKTAILHAASDTYYWKGKGALSVKTFTNGRAYYHAGQGHFAVEEGNYLLLNQDQEYAITIESDVPVESFCIFFPDKLVEEIYYSNAVSNEKLLDSPFSCNPAAIDFVEKTYSESLMVATLLQMKNEYSYRHQDTAWLEEKLFQLANGLLVARRQVHSEVLKLQSLRASTREELYKRIHIGHEYMSAYYHQSITLTDIARAACLSPNHFLRSYKQLFGMSPHQYLSNRRLQESRRLLLQTDKSITDICIEVGFQSPSSFSGLFAKRFAMSPSEFRHKR